MKNSYLMVFSLYDQHSANSVDDDLVDSTRKDVNASTPGTSHAHHVGDRFEDTCLFDSGSRESDWKPASASIKIVETMANQGISPVASAC